VILQKPEIEECVGVNLSYMLLLCSVIQGEEHRGF